MNNWLAHSQKGSIGSKAKLRLLEERSESEEYQETQKEQDMLEDR